MSFARKMLALNDEALARLTSSAYEGRSGWGCPMTSSIPRSPAS
ncbi:hypothetical protein ACFSHQ_20225 [Gemmobacter lanyuensis]